MARQVEGLKRAVDEHFDAAVGTHVRAVTGAADIGGKILDAGRGAVDAARRWWNDDGRGPRRTQDIRLPNEGKRQRGRGRQTTRSR